MFFCAPHAFIVLFICRFSKVSFLQMDFCSPDRVYPENLEPGVEAVQNKNVETVPWRHEKTFALHLLRLWPQRQVRLLTYDHFTLHIEISYDTCHTCRGIHMLVFFCSASSCYALWMNFFISFLLLYIIKLTALREMQNNICFFFQIENFLQRLLIEV